MTRTREENAADMAYEEAQSKLPKFYECGICGAWHRLEWNGDCREDAARWFPDQIDKLYGAHGWTAVEMPS